MIEFEWDNAKAKRNTKKHNVSLHEAATVFADQFSYTWSDPDHSIGEARYITLGISEQDRLIVVAHTDRGNKIRIISARKTTPKERIFYEQGK